MRHNRGMAESASAGATAAAAQGLTKVYGQGPGAIRALDGVSLAVGRGQLVAVVGPSGAGKSTLLHCLAGFEKPTSGTIQLDGHQIASMTDRALTRLRRERVGFVFQSLNLVPTLTALENITLPASIVKRRIPADRLAAVVQTLGLEGRLEQFPAELSWGQQQRIACARALVRNPALILADEPTSNLDPASTTHLFDLLRRAVDQFRQTAVLVTQDVAGAALADRVLVMDEGRIVAELESPDPDAVAEVLLSVGASPIAVSAPPSLAPAGVPGAGEVPSRTSLMDRQPFDLDTVGDAPAATPPAFMAEQAALSPEQAQIVDRAQQILDSLPGAVAPDVLEDQP